MKENKARVIYDGIEIKIDILKCGNRKVSTININISTKVT